MGGGFCAVRRMGGVSEFLNEKLYCVNGLYSGIRVSVYIYLLAKIDFVIGSQVQLFHC